MMLKTVNIDHDKNYKTLKTNLTLWVVHASSTFKLHIEKVLMECMNLNIEWIDLSHFTASLKMALRLGASDYFSQEVDLGELYPMLKVTAEEKVAARNMGSLTLFVNTKGGSLATYATGNVLLVDLDTQFSDVSDYLNSRPKYSMNDVINSISDLDELSLEGLVYKHSPILRQFYAHIVVDMSHGIEPVFQQIISPATHVYLVLQQDITYVVWNSTMV